VFVALRIHHETRMRHSGISGQPDSIIYFHIISQKGRLSRRKKGYWAYVFWFYLQLLSESFLFLRETVQDVVKNVQASSCKVPVILVLSDFNETFSFIDRFSKKHQIS
jgi:hypothetical protein